MSKANKVQGIENRETTMEEDFFAMQGEMPDIHKEAQAYNYKYADLPSIMKAIKPILQKWGFAVTHNVEYHEPSSFWVMATILIHPKGTMKGIVPLYVKSSDMQGMGSAISYAKRYGLCSLLGIVADDDDDGERSKGPAQGKPATGTISDAQAKRMFAIAKTKGWSNDQLKNLLGEFGYESSKDVKRGDYDEICNRIG